MTDTPHSGGPSGSESVQESRDRFPGSQDHYRLLFETMLQGVVHQDSAGTIIAMNPAAERILGKSRTEFLGSSSVAEQYHTIREDGSTFPGMEHPAMVALGTGREVRNVVMGVYNPREGQYRWIDVTAVPLFRGNEAGPYQVYTLFDDITENRRAQAALTHSEAHVRAILESLATAVIVLDESARRILDVNEAFLKLHGFTREEKQEILEAGFWAREWETYYADGRPVKEWPVERFLREGDLRSVELRSRHRRTGREVHALWSGAWVRDAAGRKTAIVLSATDIAEAALAQEEIRAAHERLNLHVNNSPLAVVEWDSEFHITRWAGDAERVFGWTAEEALGRPIDELPWIHPDDRPLVENVTADMVSGKSPSNVNRNRNIRKDGSVIYCEWYNTAIRSASGQLISVLSQVLDVTERIRAEEALKESERLFRELADSMPQLVWVTEADGKSIYHNRRWDEELGPAPGESVEERWNKAVHPEDRERCLAHWKDCLETGETYEIEYRLRIPSGEYRRYLGRAVPVRDSEGTIVRWFGTNTDIEESKRAEERLRDTQKLESIGLLAGGIAHDFNNLLTGILGNASIVLDEVGPDSAERVREIISNSERAAHLTRQLLAYSGKGQFLVKDLDVSEAVHELGDLLGFSIPKTVELMLNLRKRLPCIRMDPSQLHQVIMNLVINAAEAIPEGAAGRIAVSTGVSDFPGPAADGFGNPLAAGRYVWVEVADSGAGMDERTKSRIFEPFFTTKFTGRGLGLAAVAGIVRSQKGAITVETAPGRGSTFRVLFPAAGSGLHQVKEEPADSGRGCALVVDDEPAVRGFLASVLRRRGFRVVAAADGREALAACEPDQGRFDLVVLDIVMPAMCANDLLPAIMARQPDIKVLLTSGYSETEARRLCSEYPGAAFIQKPYTARQVAEAVDAVLAFRRRGA